MKKQAMGSFSLGPRDCWRTTVQSRVCAAHICSHADKTVERRDLGGVLLAAGLAGVCSGMGSEDLVCCWIGLLISPRRQILVSTLTTTLP